VISAEEAGYQGDEYDDYDPYNEVTDEEIAEFLEQVE
jgi:hypothetical protein